MVVVVSVLMREWALVPVSAGRPDTYCCLPACLPAEIGQAEPPADEPKLAFERLTAFFKQHLAA